MCECGVVVLVCMVSIRLELCWCVVLVCVECSVCGGVRVWHSCVGMYGEYQVGVVLVCGVSVCGV